MKNFLNDYLLSNSKVVEMKERIGIVGIGSYVPELELKNDDFKRCTYPPQFDEHFGIEARRVGNGESGAQMAVKAAMKALESSAVNAEDLDLVLTTQSCKDPEYLAPPMASYVQTKIGAVNATAFSVDCGFNGFLPTLSTALAFISSGHYDTIMVVAGEALMENVDYNDFKALTIGDGAGAVIVKKVEEGGVKAYHHMSAQKEKAAGIRLLPGNGHHANRDHVVKPFLKVEPISFERDVPVLQYLIPSSILEIAEKTDLSLENVDHFVFGQQFLGLTQKWMHHMNVNMDKNFDTLKSYAAMKTASIPVNLAEAYEKGLLKKGDVIALGDQGANWYISSMTLEWSI